MATGSTATKSGTLELHGPSSENSSRVLTEEALAFLSKLHQEFNQKRIELLAARQEKQKKLDAGELPSFLPETANIRESDWKVVGAPADLQDRRVEITGPCERKMMINALNSGAKVFMADLEDSLSPTWMNVIDGQVNLMDAVRGEMSFTNPNGKEYKLNAPDTLAALLVRPRGWHLDETRVSFAGEPFSGSLFDFGLYFFHNAKERLSQGKGLYLYLPKLESHEEAKLWADVFAYSEKELGLPKSTVRVTVLVETIMASFQLDEILYALKDYICGMNAGRWDYIFSAIKRFRKNGDFVLPDRSQITMTVPFMRAYTTHLVKTCHRRGAYAIGGMSAFIPSRRDQEVNKIAMQKVGEDKEREASDGFDGTWVAHPDLVPVAMREFDKKLGDKTAQLDRGMDTDPIMPEQLLSLPETPGEITEAGVRNNIRVALQYINYWMEGLGAVAIDNLMEDAATAEIARAQLWQWRVNGAELSTGEAFTADFYKKIREEETAHFSELARIEDASKLLDQLVLEASFTEFLTIPGMGFLKN